MTTGSLFHDPRATGIATSQAPDTALVRLLADMLRDEEFMIIDVKDHALLVKAGKREIMIGVRCV